MSANQTSSTIPALPKAMWLEDKGNYKDQKDNLALLLGTKGLEQFIEQPDNKNTPSQDKSDDTPGSEEAKAKAKVEDTAVRI